MTTLTMKDEKRLEIIQRVFRGELTMAEAGMVLGVSERQCYRIKARVNQQGVKGVIHGNRGRPCKRKAKEKTVKRISGIGCPVDSVNCHGGLLPRSCYRKWNECILNGKDWDVVEATHQAYRSEISKIAKR